MRLQISAEHGFADHGETNPLHLLLEIESCVVAPASPRAFSISDHYLRKDRNPFVPKNWLDCAALPTVQFTVAYR